MPIKMVICEYGANSDLYMFEDENGCFEFFLKDKIIHLVYPKTKSLELFQMLLSYADQGFIIPKKAFLYVEFCAEAYKDFKELQNRSNFIEEAFHFYLKGGDISVEDRSI